MEEKTKQKQGGSGVADTMKMAWKVGSVKTRKECCGEMKKLPRLLLGVLDLKPGGFIVTYRTRLRSSSSLTVVVVQVIDIFIRGCYPLCPDFLSQDVCFWVGLKLTTAL